MEKSKRRAIIVVMDSLGVGCMPDAAEYGDDGSDTFGHICSEKPDINMPNLNELGFSAIHGVKGKIKYNSPIGAYGRSAEKSVGKDTITGHWEMTGIVTSTPFQTFTDTGFPEEFIKKFEERIGTEVIGNYSASGTEIIKELGPEHEKTGKPIVYTSADSVFQIAVNVEVIPLERLYEICEIARQMLVGEWLVGRVIARPYIHVGDEYTRTSDRRDYSVSPPDKTVLDMISEAGMPVCAIGKIHDIFNGQGITESIHTDNNDDGIDKTLNAMSEQDGGLIFTNLVDFDAKYGHRRDAAGYADAIEAFDVRLGELTKALGNEDLLILCADHGNDPKFKGWNHTREYVPVIFYSKKFKSGCDLGTLDTFADIGATVNAFLGIDMPAEGKSLLDEFVWSAR